MNILLVNFALQANHGGYLQCYALQEVLKKMGHTVQKVDLFPKRYYPSILVLCLRIVKRLFLRFFLCRKNVVVFTEIYRELSEKIPKRNMTLFAEKYLNIVRVNNVYELKGEKYDAVIVGSDQVWRKLYSDRLLSDKSASDNAFLSFTKGWNCQRIAYAASIGVDYWEYTEEETNILQELILGFNAISVREDSAIDLLHKNLHPSLDIEHVLDPTLLLGKESYKRLFNHFNTDNHQGEILTYILDKSENKNKIISDISNSYGLPVFKVNNPNFENKELYYKERIQTSIEQWLSGFNDAKYVIADSFHACVFSVIFEKPFLVIANENRGITRITSLLKVFGLEHCLICDEINTVPKFPNIDWNRIRLIKNKQKEKSINFLKMALEKH